MTGFNTGAAADLQELGSYIKSPGDYTGTVTGAQIRTFPSGSKCLQLEIDTNAGSMRDMIWIGKKDGTPSPYGMSMVQSGFMRCAGIPEGTNITFTQVTDKEGNPMTVVPDFIGKTIGVRVSIEESGTPQKTYINTKIDHFFNPATNMTGSGKLITEYPAPTETKLAPVAAPAGMAAPQVGAAASPFRA